MTQTPAGALGRLHASAPAWAGQTDWRLLDTRFEPGLHFLTTWQAWRDDPQRPQRLHYVGLSHAPPNIADLLACAGPDPQLRALARKLAAQWFELQPGFHRFTLDRGGVVLTLCVGELISLLREQSFSADHVFLDASSPGVGATPPWNRWSAKALARCCRRGTGLTATGDVALVRADLVQCGFEFQQTPNDGPEGPDHGLLHGQFNPRWTLRAPGSVSHGRAHQPGTCVVVGAGLAGASVASALVRRGWQVQVLDRAAEPAAGASGLPVGLMVPHVSVDDCALSRLSRAGVRLMLHEARSLLQQGDDWAPSGTLEKSIDGDSHQSDIWHAQAAWLKPGQLVRAWLAQPGITFQGGAQVAFLRRSGEQWTLLDDQEQVLASADRVVLANACGASALLQSMQASHPSLKPQRHQLPTLRGVRGQVSWALHAHTPDAAFPPYPVNGAGSVIPGVPWHDGVHSARAWFAGATYQSDDQPETPIDLNHAANLARVQRLLPELGRALTQSFTDGRVSAWKGTRCVTPDRLPVVGPLNDAVHPGLWLCCGMGSRGLSFSVLCAELLAAQWGGEPWVIEARLARLLLALRSPHAVPGAALELGEANL